MPVYNAQGYVAESVASILAQTVADFELIAVDDGSTDSSLCVLEQFAELDARVRIISRPNTGIVGALNDGLAAVRGEFIARMDADDIALPHRFEVQQAFLRAHPNCVAVGSAVLQVDPDGDPICVQRWAQSHEEIERLLLRGGGGLAHPTAMIRKSAMIRSGGYRKEFEWIEDKDLWLRLAEIGRLANLPEPLLKYRVHESSICWQREKEQRQLWESLLAQTYARRNGTSSPRTFAQRSVRQGTDMRSRSKWMRAAAKSGNYRTALKHLKFLMGTRPLALSTWTALVRVGIAGLAGIRPARRAARGNSS
jgi:GT2 family glycosyltransferase